MKEFLENQRRKILLSPGLKTIAFPQAVLCVQSGFGSQSGKETQSKVRVIVGWALNYFVNCYTPYIKLVFWVVRHCGKIEGNRRLKKHVNHCKYLTLSSLQKYATPAVHSFFFFLCLLLEMSSYGLAYFMFIVCFFQYVLRLSSFPVILQKIFLESTMYKKTIIYNTCIKDNTNKPDFSYPLSN